MARIRNLKYGQLNSIVEQPVFKGINLTKWIHDGIVVWENGGIDSYILVKAASSGLPYIIDCTRNKVYEVPYNYWGSQDPIFSTQNHVYLCRIGYSNVIHMVNNISDEGMTVIELGDERIDNIMAVAPMWNGILIQTSTMIAIDVGEIVNVPYYLYYDEDSQEFVEVTTSVEDTSSSAYEVTLKFALEIQRHGDIHTTIHIGKIDSKNSPAPNKVILNHTSGFAQEDIYELKIKKNDDGEYKFSLDFLQRFNTQSNFIAVAYGNFNRVDYSEGEKIEYGDSGIVVASGVRNQFNFWLNGESIGNLVVEGDYYPRIKYYDGYFYIYNESDSTYYKTNDFSNFENITKPLKVEPYQFNSKYKGVLFSSGSIKEEGYYATRYFGLHSGNYLAYVQNNKPMLNLPFFSFSYGDQYIVGLDLQEDNEYNLVTNGIQEGDIIKNNH